MKKATSLLLVLTMVLSLFAGCGKPAAKETTAQVPAATLSAETAAPATESTTKPTLSPEELLYNSLTDRQRQAVDLGIVELSQMEDLERIVTVGEASAMLQKAYVHRTGVESKMLNELMTREEYSSRNAPRGWLMGMPGLADLELTHGEVYENYEQWFLLTGDNGGWATLWAAFDKRFGAKGSFPWKMDLRTMKKAIPFLRMLLILCRWRHWILGSMLQRQAPIQRICCIMVCLKSLVTPLRFMMTPTERNSWSWRMGISIPIGR